MATTVNYRIERNSTTPSTFRVLVEWPVGEWRVVLRAESVQELQDAIPGLKDQLAYRINSTTWALVQSGFIEVG